MGYGVDDKIGRWSIDKLQFLEKYIPSYIRATKGTLHRYYIDGFAGKGTWIHNKTGNIIDGSAAIALKYAEQFTHLHFVEYDPQRAAQLKELIIQHNAVHKATVHIGDCNELIPLIMSKIHHRAPCFVFLDPSKDQLQWITISTLAKWKTELFILFPLNMTLLRYLPRHGELKHWARPHLDPIFGTSEWYEIYRNVPRGDLANSLLDLYSSRLQGLGYEYKNVSRIFKNDNGQRLYYMIWVGKHPVGSRIMDPIFKQQPGQLELFI